MNKEELAKEKEIRAQWNKMTIAQKSDWNVQVEFPNATAEEREQLVSGICSNKCWGEFLGGSEDE